MSDAAVKHPEMADLRTALQDEKAAILASTATMRERREELRRLMAPYEVELRELTTEINRIERPRVAEIDNQIGALSRGMGGFSLQAGGG